MRPNIAATAFSQVSISVLNAHRGTRRAGHLMLFSKADVQSSENFFIPTDQGKTSILRQAGPVKPLPFSLLHCKKWSFYKRSHQTGTNRQQLHPIVSEQRIYAGPNSSNSPYTRSKVIHYLMCAQRLVCYRGG